jgi:hypothetical protein
MTRAVEEFSGKFRVPDMALPFCAELLTLSESSTRSRLGNKTNLSNSDQLLFSSEPIMKVETSIPSLSFRSTELSQLSEVVLP